MFAARRLHRKTPYLHEAISLLLPEEINKIIDLFLYPAIIPARSTQSNVINVV